MSDSPLLLNAEQAAALCSIAPSSWWALNSAGRIPQGVRLGKRRLWSRTELESWILSGCPRRDKWQGVAK